MSSSNTSRNMLQTDNLTTRGIALPKFSRPHRMQRAILKRSPKEYAPMLEKVQSSDVNRHHILACGRRFGKTELLAYLIISEMLRGGDVGFFTPSYKYGTPVWRAVKSKLEPITIEKNEQEKYLAIKAHGVNNIGTLDMWSLNGAGGVESGRGRDYSRVLYDEATLIRNLEASWHESVSLTLTKRKGDAWFAGTPKGFDFFKTLFDKGVEGSPSYDPEFISWQLPTYLNPWLEAVEVEKFRDRLPPDVFRQEVLAEFNRKQGLLFQGKGVRFYDELPHGEGYLEGVGLDFAYSSKKTADYSVAITGRKYGTDIYITDMLRGQMPADEFMPLVASRGGYLHGAYIGGQESGVLDLTSAAYGLEIERFQASKDKYTRALTPSLLWNRGQIFLPRCQKCAGDSSYCPDGMGCVDVWVNGLLDEVLSFSGVLDYNDDIVDALGSLVQLLEIDNAPPAQSFMWDAVA